jgi:hypothetical protein
MQQQPQLIWLASHPFPSARLNVGQTRRLCTFPKTPWLRQRFAAAGFDLRALLDCPHKVAALPFSLLGAIKVAPRLLGDGVLTLWSDEDFSIARQDIIAVAVNVCFLMFATWPVT